MPFTKPKACHGSCYLVYRYLTGEKTGQDRVLDSDYHLLEGGRPWWKEMDDTREAMPARRAAGRGRERSYSHYIIAPDPADLEGLPKEEALRRVRAVANGWVDRYLADYQVAIIYHDDGANGNIHAHIVANVVNMRTGLRRQESRADWKRATHIVDELSREVGLHALADRLPGAEAETVSILEELNARRRSRGESVVLRDPTHSVTTLQEEALTQAERHIRRRRARTWKDDVRTAADYAAAMSQSFEEYQAALRRSGYDVYQNRRGNLVYVHRDGEHRFRDGKLGRMYQADFLATRFMDLRFTKAGWNARRGEYERLEEGGIRVPRVTRESVNEALAVWGRNHVGDVSDAARTIDIMRANAGELARRIESYRSLERSIAQDIADRELVDRAAPVIEQWRVDGRVVDSCPQPTETVAAYEAARKRLMRRDHVTDLPSLRGLQAAYQSAIDADTDRLGEITTAAEEVMRATATIRAIDDYLRAGKGFERRRYGERITIAAVAVVSGGAARRQRHRAPVPRVARASWRPQAQEDNSERIRWYRNEVGRLLAEGAARNVQTGATDALRDWTDAISVPFPTVTMVGHDDPAMPEIVMGPPMPPTVEHDEVPTNRPGQAPAEEAREERGTGVHARDVRETMPTRQATQRQDSLDGVEATGIERSGADAR